MINEIMIIVGTIIIISMFNSLNELLKIIIKKVNEESLNTRRLCKQFKFGEFCLETNLLKNIQFLGKISITSIPTVLKWKMHVIKTKLKTISDGSWTKKLNIFIGARPRAETFSLRRPARSSIIIKLVGRRKKEERRRKLFFRDISCHVRNFDIFGKIKFSFLMIDH